MEIDLTPLHQNTISEIKIQNKVELPKEYYESSDIISLKPIEISGVITKKELEEEEKDYFEGEIKGEMILLDSISLEEVSYPYSSKYQDFIPENCIKNENLLDIFSFLWENIVLEVPLQFTKVEDLSKYHGDGWKLMSEDDYHLSNNPFVELLKDFDKE